MKRHLICVLSATLLNCAWPNQVSAIDAGQVLTKMEGKIVHLRVAGQEAPGETFVQPIHGSGVIVKTGASDPKLKFRILTAGHVVKSDASWAPLGSRVNRDVYIIAEYGPGSIEFRPVTGVLVNGQSDIAQVVTGPTTALAADLNPTPLISGNKYVVVSWGMSGDRVAESAGAKVVRVMGADDVDPELVQLEGELVPTESGSPVLDETGAVVAIVVMREVTGGISNKALALPIQKFIEWIRGDQGGPVTEAARADLATLVGQTAGLCIFLGKRSALARKQLRYPDAPFGREILSQVQQRASGQAEPNFTIFDQPLRIAPQAEAINVRSRCPEIEDGKAYYGSVVSQLTPKTKIKVGAIQAMRYLDDVFYWARVTDVTSSE
ncbi:MULTISPECIES: serine protease [unclassified Bradyrhizobium]|uniref:S1 family peptidase n=1 Tax=unclassified Bradyrhizobium TaxID=2631580 RepID=UPI0028E76B8B|nr:MULTISPECIES: serine protease [unclassified Bradyrhizobium]